MGTWQPPLEARELGSGAPTAVRPGKRSPFGVALIVVAVGVLALLVIGKVISLAEGSREDPLEGVVRGFVDARAAGEGGRACNALTERAQRDMVALVRGVEPTQASASDCERYVLLSSERSQFTDPALPAFRDRDLNVKHFPGADGRRYATVRPRGLADPVLELRKVRGAWKLDGLAAERVSFIMGCTDSGAARAYCACAFDALAEAGRATSDDLDEMFRAGQAGAVPPVVARAAAACGR